ncbi:MAG TPA: hypothetical protein VM509_15400 [Planctomycetota bacterium]|nr:hypothetical protein [Planctomycetota bacterium]
MTRSVFALLLAAAALACVSSTSAEARRADVATSASCRSVLVTVDCGPLHRVDTRWDVRFEVVKPDGSSCEASINVPPDSTASEIASSMASAIEAVCEVHASSTRVDPISSRVELASSGATFGEIRRVEYEREIEDRPGIGPSLVCKTPKPRVGNELRIAKLAD